MQMKTGLPPRQGLNPRHEHERVRRGLRRAHQGRSLTTSSEGPSDPQQPRHRGATGPIRCTATAQACWCRSPTRFSRGDGEAGVKLPRGAYGVEWRSCRAIRGARACCARSSAPSPTRDSRTWAGATCRWTIPPRPDRARHHAGHPPGVSWRGRGSLDRDAFERSSTSSGRPSGHAIRALGLSNAGEFYCPRSASHHRTRHAARRAGGPVLSRPHGQALRLGVVPSRTRFLHHPSPRGTWRTRSASSRTTARSTAARATQMDQVAPGDDPSKLLGDDLDKIWPLIYPGSPTRSRSTTRWNSS